MPFTKMVQSSLFPGRYLEKNSVFLQFLLVIIPLRLHSHGYGRQLTVHEIKSSSEKPLIFERPREKICCIFSFCFYSLFFFCCFQIFQVFLDLVQVFFKFSLLFFFVREYNKIKTKKEGIMKIELRLLAAIHLQTESRITN